MNHSRRPPVFLFFLKPIYRLVTIRILLSIGITQHSYRSVIYYNQPQPPWNCASSACLCAKCANPQLWSSGQLKANPTWALAYHFGVSLQWLHLRSTVPTQSLAPRWKNQGMDCELCLYFSFNYITTLYFNIFCTSATFSHFASVSMFRQTFA